MMGVFPLCAVTDPLKPVGEPIGSEGFGFHELFDVEASNLVTSDDLASSEPERVDRKLSISAPMTTQDIDDTLSATPAILSVLEGTRSLPMDTANMVRFKEFTAPDVGERLTPSVSGDEIVKRSPLDQGPIPQVPAAEMEVDENSQVAAVYLEQPNMTAIPFRSGAEFVSTEVNQSEKEYRLEANPKALFARPVSRGLQQSTGMNPATVAAGSVLTSVIIEDPHLPSEVPFEIPKNVISLSMDSIKDKVPPPPVTHSQNGLALGTQSLRTIPADTTKSLDTTNGSAWLDQLSNDIAVLSKDNNRLNFQLKPSYLGKLSVTLAAGESGDIITIAAENENAKSVIASAQNRLEQDFRYLGSRSVRIDISLADGSSEQAHEGKSGSLNSGQQHRSENAPSAVQADNAVPSPNSQKQNALYA